MLMRVVVSLRRGLGPRCMYVMVLRKLACFPSIWTGCMRKFDDAVSSFEASSVGECQKHEEGLTAAASERCCSVQPAPSDVSSRLVRLPPSISSTSASMLSSAWIETALGIVAVRPADEGL